MQLYAIVFISRYTDIFDSLFDIFNLDFLHWYNLIMKIIYLYLTISIVYTITYKNPYRGTYDKEHDSFQLKYAIVPCLVLAAIFNNHNSVITVFSYLYLIVFRKNSWN